MRKLSLDEYLALRGLSFPISNYTLDKTVFPHGLTKKQHDKLYRNVLKQAEEYQEKRAAAIAEYRQLVASGEIEPKTNLERTIELAKYGHPDNESTQAAIRLCHKKGIII